MNFDTEMAELTADDDAQATQEGWTLLLRKS